MFAYEKSRLRSWNAIYWMNEYFAPVMRDLTMRKKIFKCVYEYTIPLYLFNSHWTRTEQLLPSLFIKFYLFSHPFDSHCHLAHSLVVWAIWNCCLSFGIRHSFSLVIQLPCRKEWAKEAERKIYILLNFHSINIDFSQKTVVNVAEAAWMCHKWGGGGGRQLYTYTIHSTPLFAAHTHSEFEREIFLHGSNLECSIYFHNLPIWSILRDMRGCRYACVYMHDTHLA